MGASGTFKTVSEGEVRRTSLPRTPLVHRNERVPTPGDAYGCRWGVTRAVFCDTARWRAILYGGPTDARVQKTDRGEVRPVLGGWHLQHARGRRRPQPPAAVRTHQEPRAARPLQRRGAYPGEHQQLPVEHALDLQGPGPTRCQAGGHVHRTGLAERGRGQRAFVAGGPRFAGLHRPLPVAQRNAAKAISTVSASTVSFLFLRLFVFRPKKEA